MLRLDFSADLDDQIHDGRVQCQPDETQQGALGFLDHFFRLQAPDQFKEERLLRVKPVFRLVIENRGRAIHHL